MKKAKLITELIHHDRKAQELDKRLRALCEAQIRPLITSGDYDAAKKQLKEFYKELPEDVVAIERDLLMASINRMIRGVKIVLFAAFLFSCSGEPQVELPKVNKYGERGVIGQGLWNLNYISTDKKTFNYIKGDSLMYIRLTSDSTAVSYKWAVK
jgi:hypothetical protein